MTASVSPSPTRTEFREPFETHKKHFNAVVRHTSARERIQKLKALKKWIFAHEADIHKALYADFKKNPAETDLTEIRPVVAEIKDTIAHLHDWMRPVHVSTPITLIGTSGKVVREPRGVVMIMAPWNFPFQLTVGPLVSAIAAGCAIMIKPSEVSAHTAELLEKMCADLFDPKEISIHQGDATVAQALLELPFNHIFFTGSPQVGKLVMKAAAEHLTSVTLELGGVNPVIVDETANLKSAARRIAWGKFFNCGQACVSPNHLFIHQSVFSDFTSELKKAIEKLYGDQGKIKSNADYARVINDRHYGRIKSLLEDSLEKGAKVMLGGTTDDSDNFIAPTLLTDVPEDAEVLQDEIFGPVLPLVPYQQLENVVDRINQFPDPLSLYIFSGKKKHIDYVLTHTQAGTMGINEVVAQFGHPNLPFGGQNNSGIGKAHGFWGFMAFTHERAVLKKTLPISAPQFIFPPYTNYVKKFIKILTKWF